MRVSRVSVNVAMSPLNDIETFKDYGENQWANLRWDNQWVVATPYNNPSVAPPLADWLKGRSRDLTPGQLEQIVKTVQAAQELDEYTVPVPDPKGLQPKSLPPRAWTKAMMTPYFTGGHYNLYERLSIKRSNELWVDLIPVGVTLTTLLVLLHYAQRQYRARRPVPWPG